MKRTEDYGFITLLGALVIIIVLLMMLLFIQNYTLLLCANWFPITMIILAFGVFIYLKNKSGGKK